MDALLRRYRAGERERVWKELTPRNGLDVARETMSRVRKNVELLEQRLRSSGYAFAGDICPAIDPSPRDPSGTVHRIEKLFGPLPLALRVFHEIVGAVNFLAPDGVYAGEPWRRLKTPDPLVVWPLKESFESDYGEWKLMSAAEREEYGPFRLDFSPDYYHKDNISGGAPYGIRLPQEEADPRVLDEARRISFVEHLRLATRGGGFLRMDTQPASLREAVKTLTKDLLPF